MPLLKRLINLGKVSKAVVIPNEWLDYYKNQGIPIDMIIMEINNKITIRIPEGNELGVLSPQEEQPLIESAELEK